MKIQLLTYNKSIKISDVALCSLGTQYRIFEFYSPVAKQIYITFMPLYAFYRAIGISVHI